MELALLDDKTHYRAIIMNSVWYGSTSRKISQWNGIKSMQSDSHMETSYIKNIMLLITANEGWLFSNDAKLAVYLSQDK